MPSYGLHESSQVLHAAVSRVEECVTSWYMLELIIQLSENCPKSFIPFAMLDGYAGGSQINHFESRCIEECVIYTIG